MSIGQPGNLRVIAPSCEFLAQLHVAELPFSALVPPALEGQRPIVDIAAGTGEPVHQAILCSAQAQLELIGLQPLHAEMLALPDGAGQRYWVGAYAIGFGKKYCCRVFNTPALDGLRDIFITLWRDLRATLVNQMATLYVCWI